MDSRVLIEDKVSKNEVINVEISPIYAVDVTTSAQHIVNKIVKHKHVKTQTPSKSSVKLEDNTLNLSYVDVFGPNQNFTIGTWIKPMSKGIIAANRRSYYRDAKGWYIEIDNAGKLHFYAAFYQNSSLNQTYNQGDDQSISVMSDAAIALNEWQHIAVAVE
ncbi:LamG domain-containing protein [Gelidibacter salicanalis]|uniref:LamG domain-containing protein n=1 Tax=Gelidibacter salicanalis TaxID=291193 RepID=A0A5C7AC37_9FLAO|nr:LamG domain-containing protein [Gelidibacter salicanalis]TXE05981.1 LamG domain-containing protein [Gelidibacter salicanalis]